MEKEKMINAFTTIPQKKEGEPIHELHQIKMNIKETLKANGITQEEFANHLGVTREGLNLNLNKGKQKKSIEEALKLYLAEKRGFSFELKDDKIILTIKN